MWSLRYTPSLPVGSGLGPSTYLQLGYRLQGLLPLPQLKPPGLGSALQRNGLRDVPSFALRANTLQEPEYLSRNFK